MANGPSLSDIKSRSPVSRQASRSVAFVATLMMAHVPVARNTRSVPAPWSSRRFVRNILRPKELSNSKISVGIDINRLELYGAGRTSTWRRFGVRGLLRPDRSCDTGLIDWKAAPRRTTATDYNWIAPSAQSQRQRSAAVGRNRRAPGLVRQQAEEVSLPRTRRQLTEPRLRSRAGMCASHPVRRPWDSPERAVRATVRISSRRCCLDLDRSRLSPRR